MKNYKELLKNISTIFLDYDGVLTDGTILINENGDQLRTGYVKDGYAIQFAIKQGYRIVIITGGSSDSIRRRCESLNISEIFLCVRNKSEFFQEFTRKNNLKLSEIAYLGDDIPDYLPMKKAGLAVCPADAAEEIKKISHYISHYKGGKGCVRDLIEQILKVQGKWMQEDAFEW
jgi:3-deoxy-D-manno-octulosonate 8-phosphate phosphatase (KDO 8-P phosphatase)